MKTGFEKLDIIINKLNEGELTCIAGRPGIGKTTLSIDIVNNVAKQTDNKILFISLENSKEQLEKRIKSDNVEIITDKLNIKDIEDTCRNLYYTNHYLSLIVIDYLSLIKPIIKRKEQQREIVEILKSLKQLALDLNVPMIINHLLPRTSHSPIPTLEDVNINSTTYFYSKVLLLYKDENNDLMVEVVKNKDVPRRYVNLDFDKETLSFSERK